jgi:hypothetical protein
VTYDVRANAVEITGAFPKGSGEGRGLFQEGEKVSFRVLEALPQDRYRISAKNHPFVVTSRIPLSVGSRYVAEAALRNGRVLLLYQTTQQALLELAANHRGTQQRPVASTLQNLSLPNPLPSTLTSMTATPEGVRTAILHCGLFYEARLREWLQGKERLQPLQDLKGYLLAQLREATSAGLRDSLAAALRNLEGQQLFSVQAGMEGSLPFCLPFGDRRLIEGFVKRGWSSSGSGLILALRVPFLDAEDLLVIVSWKPREVEVCFSPGEEGHSPLREAAHQLEEQLEGLGLTRIRVRVSKRLPRHLRQGLSGSGFLDSYG